MKNNDTKDLGLRHYKSILIIIQRFVAGSWLARFASEPRLCMQPLLLLIKNMANDVNL